VGLARKNKNAELLTELKVPIRSAKSGGVREPQADPAQHADRQTDGRASAERC